MIAVTGCGQADPERDRARAEVRETLLPRATSIACERASAPGKWDCTGRFGPGVRVDCTLESDRERYAGQCWATESRAVAWLASELAEGDPDLERSFRRQLRAIEGRSGALRDPLTLSPD